MHYNKLLYTLIIFASFALKSVLTLDTVEGQAILWFSEYVQDLSHKEKIELYNGLNDISCFIGYKVIAQKKTSLITKLTTLLNTATIDEEAQTIKALSILINDLAIQYPIKTNYEARVCSFYDQCEKNVQLKQALNACFSDFKNFIKQETTEDSSLLILQIEKTNGHILDFMKSLESLQEEAKGLGIISRDEFRENLINSHYKCQNIIAEEIYQYTIEASENQKLLNTLILFYMDTIIKKIDL